MMPILRAIGVSAFLAACLGLVVFVPTPVAIAQVERERPKHETKQWVGVVFTAEYGSDFIVRVVDFEGACLYVTERGAQISTVAVPKTQLKPGVGCS